MQASDLRASERVHVAPLGFEHDRVVEAAKQLRADRLILLEWAEGEQPDFFEDVYRDIDEANIERETRSCDIRHMYDVIRVTARAVRQYAGDNVFVNISTGTKISAIGGTIACMVTDAVPYYVTPSHYSEESSGRTKPFSYGIENIHQLPAYPIDGPEKQHVYVLEYLFRHGPVTKKELIEFGQGKGKEIGAGGPERGLPFVTEFESSSNKARYRLLDNHILNPLERNEFIKMSSIGRRKDIDITKKGENTLSAFRHLIES